MQEVPSHAVQELSKGNFLCRFPMWAEEIDLMTGEQYERPRLQDPGLTSWFLGLDVLYQNKRGYQAPLGNWRVHLIKNWCCCLGLFDNFDRLI